MVVASTEHHIVWPLAIASRINAQNAGIADIGVPGVYFSFARVSGPRATITYYDASVGDDGGVCRMAMR